MRLYSDIVHRGEAFGGVAFHLETKRFYPLNRPGYWLLQSVDAGKPLPQLVQGFAQLYKSNTGRDISALKSNLIVDDFLRRLTEQGILECEDSRENKRRSSGELTSIDNQAPSFDIYSTPLRSPLVVSLAVLSQCNLLCSHCYVTSTSEVKPDNLTKAEAKDILSRLAAIDVFDVVITGGEPLMFDGIYELLSHAKDLGLYVCLNTNGTLLTQRAAEKIKLTGVDVVKISIDSPLPEIHSEFRGQVRSWERSIEGIRRLVQAEVRVDTQTVISVKSLASTEDLHRLLKLGEYLGVTQMHFGRVFSTGRSTDEFKLAQDHSLGMTRQLSDLKQQGHPLVGRFPSTSIPKVPSIPTYDGCGQCARSNYVYIAYNGEVYPCTNLYKREWRLGTLRQASLGEILGESKVLADLGARLAGARGGAGLMNLGVHV